MKGTRPIKEKLHSSASWNETCLKITSNAVTIAIVDLLDGPVPEGQFPHPVDSAAHAGGQTKVGVGGRCLESISAEVVIATITHTTDTRVLQTKSTGCKKKKKQT